MAHQLLLGDDPGYVDMIHVHQRQLLINRYQTRSLLEGKIALLFALPDRRHYPSTNF